jgi:uncharacterized membrane protein YfcA
MYFAFLSTQQQEYFNQSFFKSLPYQYPVAVLGVFVGSKIDKKIDEKIINQLMITTFILGGFSIFVKALIFKE